MYPARHPGPPPQPGQPFKFTISESCDRIKEEFSFLQAQYHSLKLECEKLASEKTEMQRHYVMYYEMSYGLNVEMHKQTEIAKRLNAIIAQILPFLSQEHQQQVAAAVERAKQVTMTELNAIIGIPPHAQAAAAAAAAAHGLPMMPHAAAMAAAGLQAGQGMPGGAGGSAAGLLALSSSLAAAAAAAGGVGAPGGPGAAHLGAITSSANAGASLKDHRSVDEKRSSSAHSSEERQRNSISPNDREKFRSRTPDLEHEIKKRKSNQEKDSDGEKSDQELVVDVANEDSVGPPNGGPLSPRENGTDKVIKKEHPPHSPHSSISSNSSTPSSKHKENEKSTTPVPKSLTPTSSSSGNMPGSSGLKPVSKGPPLGPPFPYSLHGGGPGGHPGLPADLTAAAAAYSQGLLHNNISPAALNSYSRSLVSSFGGGQKMLTASESISVSSEIWRQHLKYQWFTE